MKSWRRTKPFATSQKKSRNSAPHATAARFMMIARLIAIAFTAKLAARMMP
jgi:ribonuclease PH